MAGLMPRPPIEPVDLTFGAGSDSVLWMDAVPVFCNALATTAEAALAAPTGIIELAYSPATGYLWNRAFDPGLAAYNPAYENALHYSPRFVSFAESLADRLIERYRLREVVEFVAVGAGEVAAAHGDDVRQHGVALGGQPFGDHPDLTGAAMEAVPRAFETFGYRRHTVKVITSQFGAFC